MLNKENINFSHVPNFTGYMKVVEKIIKKNYNKKLKILDLPAGNGLLSKALRKLDHDVVSADFNRERKDYDYVDMGQKLPYKDMTFDLIVCLEGIEHLVDPYSLIKEFNRITKLKGNVIISMPNVQSIYSRLKFLFTGTFYQFEPEASRLTYGKSIDRGHVSPLALPQLAYLFNEQGFKLKQVSGDKIKKKILLPLYLIIGLINKIHAKKNSKKYSKDIYLTIGKNKSLLCRSLILLWVKE